MTTTLALRPRNPVLNGKPVEENEALASGDVIEVEPFRLEIDTVEAALAIRVELQIGMKLSEIDVSDPGLSTDNLVAPDPKGRNRAPPRFQEAKRSTFFGTANARRRQDVPPSQPYPKGGRRSGKAQFNWAPTTDLMSRWPVAFFTWSVLIVGLVSVAAAYWYTSAFAPAPISQAHAATQFSLIPRLRRPRIPVRALIVIRLPGVWSSAVLHVTTPNRL